MNPKRLNNEKSGILWEKKAEIFLRAFENAVSIASS